jgi:nucleotide-binding universal stress UspA family protein
MNKIPELPKERIKHMLVGLDLTEMDDYVIPYADKVAKRFGAEKIYFVHVTDDLELPQSLASEYPDIQLPLDEGIAEEIEKKLKKELSEEVLNKTEVIVKEGSHTEKMLRLSKVKQIDLIVMGRKQSLEGSGLLSGNVARKAPCHLLLVTEDPHPAPERIVVPFDFSENAANALSYALQLNGHQLDKILPIHLFTVPPGHHKTGKSYSEFAKILQGHAEKNFELFKKKNELEGMNGHFAYGEKSDFAKMAHQFAEDQNADAMVLGSKGRTNLSAILLGSFAEKMILKDHDVPLMIAKKKGENLDFFEALLKI